MNGRSRDLPFLARASSGVVHLDVVEGLRARKRGKLGGAPALTVAPAAAAASSMAGMAHGNLPGNVASLTAEMQRNYGLLGELDCRFHDLQKHMETQYGHALQDMIQAARRENVPSNALILEHSNRIASVQKECMSIAEEKLALAVQTYEMVDTQIQQLEADYKKLEEELKRGRDSNDGGYLDYETERLQQRGRGPQRGRGKGKMSILDSSEPRYCYCNQVAYGEMIACDNPECKLEWFHFDCAGVKERPKGRWYCMECSSSRKRRGN